MTRLTNPASCDTFSARRWLQQFVSTNFCMPENTMNRYAVCTAALVASLVLALSGCTASNALEGGAFLSNYGDLKQTADSGGAFVYANKNAELWRYDKFVIEPLLIRFRPDFAKPVEMSQVDQFEKAYREAVAGALTKGNAFKQVNGPGPNTLLVRGAVTDTRETGYRTDDGRASMEVQLLDGVNNSTVFAMVQPRFAVAPDGKVSNDPRGMFTRWATNLRNQLDRARAQAIK
jgi:hypothetical protein